MKMNLQKNNSASNDKFTGACLRSLFQLDFVILVWFWRDLFFSVLKYVSQIHRVICYVLLLNEKKTLINIALCFVRENGYDL